ncbi:DUF1836 domain-containing protein [Aquibacillus kalidii]|uniref:DUF1836 domain-containing protein n=1 Tax=Aquibacillus kalidii TaxID=2762597 RepID=UPI0016466F34|nr:DUF1836 domain-containing protein [Aquibacillus kalidii]
MKTMEDIISELNLNQHLTLEEMPKIDLYMDQVTQLFENTFESSKRNDEDKILTKTMINNYAKGKILYPIKNKKYSRNNLILISLIYHLKGTLSINDVKSVLNSVNDKAEEEESNLEALYASYLALQTQKTKQFITEADDLEKMVKQERTVNNKLDAKHEQLLLISTFVNASNMYRRVAERLVDELEQSD